MLQEENPFNLSFKVQIALLIKSLTRYLSVLMQT
jgi:hypothetical protein